METRIAGIPCTIDYTVYGKYVPAKTNADPDSCYEAEYPEIEFTVCDRRGRPALWLACKLSDDDIRRIESEILEQT
jgi:hypothetical protein